MMLGVKQQWLFVILGSIFSYAAQAVTFSSQLDNTRWQLEASKFSCRLSQEIPTFGRAVFEHEAGEAVRFQLQPIEKVHFTQGAELFAEAAPWQPGLSPWRIGSVKQDGQGKLDVRSEYAQNMLAALSKGMMPTFTSAGWYGTDESLRVAVSAVNFQTAYSDYVNCTSDLLPVNFRQVARTAILFPAAQTQLSDASRERLRLIALYVQNDNSVKSLYIDGHSDNLGRRLLNRDLSKQRAEAVTDYLVSLGISSDIITTRYHGERYPVVKNNSAENRTRNRRVTIRLERE
ncbi:flagellar protein MotY [Pontibacter sp. JAM-7]|uniref:flagellar protein MotY n=1 Tax=Pontibacter sp. JAM-7 TaxID=3366581 RepID=UPI003AF4D254